MSRRRGQAWRTPLLVFLLCLGLAESAHRSTLLAPLDHLYSDLWHVLAGSRYRPEHVALVGIDEQTLFQYRDQPLAFWTPLFAQAIDNLRRAGVSQIGVDFMFAVSPENWLRQLDAGLGDVLRDYDLAFRQQLNAGNVVLAATSIQSATEGEPDTLMLPQMNYLFSVPDFDLAAHIGLADLVVDGDGAVRRFRLVPDVDLAADQREGAPRYSLAALLALRQQGQPLDAAAWTFHGHALSAAESLPISFGGPPGSVPKLSMSVLLRDEAWRLPEVAALAGKVVIIGADYLGMGDVHFTPYSRSLLGTSGGLMPGPEIQASIAETLLSGRFTRPLPAGARIALLVLVLLAATLAFMRLRPLSGLLLLAAALALPFLVGLALFGSFLLLPAAHLQLAMVAAFMLSYGQRMTGEAREKARIRRIFDRYVSDSVVDLLVDSDELPELGGKAVTVTILFSDIRSFTTISERLDAGEVVEFLNEYFERVCRPILEEGGTIDKFIGDAVMVQFGAPLPFNDHARRAVRAALRMGEEAAGFRQWMRDRFPDRELPDFDIGIGLHTGRAVVGNIGSRKRSEYTAIGDTVNLASRLEGVTKQMRCRIVASAEALAAAGPGVRAGRHQVVQVKGRREAVEAVEILGIDEERST